MNKQIIMDLIQRLREPNYQCYGCELSGDEAEIVIEILERQIPKQPVTSILKNPVKIGNTTFGKGTKLYKCPSCDGLIAYYKFCCNCGQAIDWGGINNVK